MSSLRAFRFQKSRPASSSPGSVASETQSPASEKTLVSSQNGENGGNSAAPALSLPKSLLGKKASYLSYSLLL